MQSKFKEAVDFLDGEWGHKLKMESERLLMLLELYTTLEQWPQVKELAQKLIVEKCAYSYSMRLIRLSVLTTGQPSARS